MGSQRREARAATPLELHQRGAEFSLVVAQQSPRGAIGNAARNDGGRERSMGCNSDEQWNETGVDRFAGIAGKAPPQCRDDFQAHVPMLLRFLICIEALNRYGMKAIAKPVMRQRRGSALL